MSCNDDYKNKCRKKNTGGCDKRTDEPARHITYEC